MSLPFRTTGRKLRSRASRLPKDGKIRENERLEPPKLMVWVDVSPFPRGHFQVPAVSFQGCISGLYSPWSIGVFDVILMCRFLVFAQKAGPCHDFVFCAGFTVTIHNTLEMHKHKMLCIICVYIYIYIYTICFIRFQSTFSILNQNNLRKRIISILLVFPTLLYLVRGNIIILQTKTSYQSGPFIMGTAWAERKACGLAFGW